MPPEQAETTETLKWAYEELQRIEQHWTDQIQNQQRRVAAVLAVNGFLLAFLAAAGLQFSASAQTGWFRIPLDICLVLLALGLVFGVLALVPRIPIAGPHPAAAHRADPGPAPDLLRLEPTVRRKPPATNVGTWLEEQLVPHADTRINKGETLEDAWLDSRVVWSAVTGCLPDPATLTGLDQVLFRLCSSAAENADWNRAHKETNDHRRAMMNRDIALVVLALGALLVAIFGRMLSSG